MVEAVSTANPVTEVYNWECAGMIRRVNAVIIELAESQSAASNQFYPADLIRVKDQYIPMLRRYRDNMVATPLMDFPKTHPDSTFPVDRINNRYVNDTMQNNSIIDMVRMLELLRDSLAHSDTARSSSSIVSHDKVRFDAVIDRLELFVDEYVVPTQPIDMPESGPAALMPKAGVTGIEGTVSSPGGS